MSNDKRVTAAELDAHGFRWRLFTANSHGLYLDEVHVASVSRLQKHRRDGTKHDWRITVLGGSDFNRTFRQFDPRDLESTKRAAEARVRFAISMLHSALRQMERS